MPALPTAALEPDPDEKLYTASLRAGLVAWHLANGEGLTTQDVMRICRISASGAGKLMRRLSLRLPIYLDADGVWQRCEIREQVA